MSSDSFILDALKVEPTAPITLVSTITDMKVDNGLVYIRGQVHLQANSRTAIHNL